MQTSLFHKRREPATPGSIPERLEMFTREVRFYREIADDVGVRTPRCHAAELDADGSTHLALEDLTAWDAEPAPEAVGQLLRGLHDRWRGTALERWPWLARPDASDLVEDLYGRRWPDLEARPDLPDDVRELGRRLVGRVAAATRAAASAGPPTLVHGDASPDNMRGSPSGEIALLDWEDFDWKPGVTDLAWHLMSSRTPERWNDVTDAYGEDAGLDLALPAAAVQSLLCLASCEEESQRSREWIASLAAAARRLRG